MARVKKDNFLQELEAILASCLYEFPATACKLAVCPSAVQASANVARRIADRLSYEWGGQIMYIKGAGGRMPEDVEDFFTDLEAFIRKELHNGSSFSDCKSCSHVHHSWDDVVTEMLSDVLAAFQRRQIYVPFDHKRRDALIYREFTGANAGRLARKYRLSRAAIYKILRRCHAAIRQDGYHVAISGEGAYPGNSAGA